MELNKCKRCGSFFASHDNICPKCMPKDMCELNKLKDFLSENELPSSIDALSYGTGISAKNLNRFLEGNNLSVSLDNLNNGNVSIEL